jgi:hypothetical protein
MEVLWHSREEWAETAPATRVGNAAVARLGALPGLV